jgi:hypothetical protein
MPSGNFRSIWSESPTTSTYYSNYLWYEQGETYGNINVAIDQWTFQNTIQLEHKTTLKEVTLEMRMVYYTRDGVLLNHLSTSVNLKVINDH